MSYTPNANYFGTGTPSPTPSATATGTATGHVNVTVTASTTHRWRRRRRRGRGLAPRPEHVLANDSFARRRDARPSPPSAHRPTAPSWSPAAVSYTPNANYFGTDSFTYTVSDGAAHRHRHGQRDRHRVNDTPTAVDDAATVAEDSGRRPRSTSWPTTPTLDGGDPAVTVGHAAGQRHRRPHRRRHGLTYTPNANYFRHGHLHLHRHAGGPPRRPSRSTVTGVNDPPTPVDDAPPSPRTRRQPRSTSWPTTPTPTRRDLDRHRGHPAGQRHRGHHGGGSVTYTPNANYCGTRTPSPTPSDGNGGTDGDRHGHRHRVNDTPTAVTTRPPSTRTPAPP